MVGWLSRLARVDRIFEQIPVNKTYMEVIVDYGSAWRAVLYEYASRSQAIYLINQSISQDVSLCQKLLQCRTWRGGRLQQSLQRQQQSVGWRLRRPRWLCFTSSCKPAVHHLRYKYLPVVSLMYSPGCPLIHASVHCDHVALAPVIELTLFKNALQLVSCCASCQL